MCPVPKAVQEAPEKEATALPIAAVDVTTNIDTSAGSSNLIHNIVKNPSIENIVQQIQSENDERYLYFIDFTILNLIKYANSIR